MATPTSIVNPLEDGDDPQHTPEGAGNPDDMEDDPRRSPERRVLLSEIYAQLNQGAPQLSCSMKVYEVGNYCHSMCSLLKTSPTGVHKKEGSPKASSVCLQSAKTSQIIYLQYYAFAIRICNSGYCF